MSIDLEIIFGHNLDRDWIANLPTLLNRYFAHHLKNIQLRLDAERRNLLGIEEDVWQWCYEEKYGKSFEEWFQTQKSEGYIPINGFAGLMLFVGERAVCLGTDIKWHHFLLDSIVQEDLRNFIPYLLDFFGANCRSIIYTAGGCKPAAAILDDYIMKGWSIEQIIPHLNDIQPPAKSIKDLIITDKDGEIESLKYDGYYMENL